ncbi:serine/threonine protein kinase [Luteolibacter luteus]|uniref:Serine/threonine protein kinase n=1 Tax=Luteolibacter luteus TaxID=2728835 RepID=A0A858RER7_9BACT|nr:serine/threonine-protein kinase [Luteolibacter luteus]QJE95101.1 serine/threonine protein kinase [Luteolibacter luteus]
MGTESSQTGSAMESSDMEDAIFDTALHIEDPAERRLYLERSFRDDSEGLTRMTELLELAGESAAFFIETRKHRDLLAEDTLMAMSEEDHRNAAAPHEDEPDSIIGRYRLIGRIGSGGGGIVYEAEQQEPVKRRVALKVIRLGMDTETVISRFEVERQALALMDHPNIARVLDAGATSGGRPYFVMELVRGDRITTYCDKEKLGLTERLGLFIQVCHAIQHAHQKGIIHRDIKPSNILVATHDGLAQPKVIDFGIAKATENRLSSAAMSTLLDQPMGTPAYMSPEQVDMGGIDIDTRSDVYGLGALLYELLAGRPPFDGDALLKSGMSEMRRTILEKDPLLPSASLGAAGPEAAEIAVQRCSERNRLISLLTGDLDWIVMKALEKDRNRRYQTANSLAMDVQRFLSDEPVLARRPGSLYLIGKFFRRNRVACISGGAVAISLIGGMGAATVLYLRERQALVEQERLRQEAESARAEESRLRGQAQARANISRVAVLLSEGKIEDADALLQKESLAFIDPSREAAGVFRSLGNWYAVYGRWEQALQCFTLLHQANRLDSRRNIVEGLDLIYTAPAYLEHGDLKSYDAFRNEVVNLYLPARNTIEAEHLLKVCLLAPAPPEVLAELKQVADMCSRSIPVFPDATGAPSYPEWEAFSLALYHYRLGEFEKMREWSRISRITPDKVGSRIASLLCLEAMAKQAEGHMQEAGADLRKARELIPSPPDPADETSRPLPGNWFSWSVARILHREAERKRSR